MKWVVCCCTLSALPAHGGYFDPASFAVRHQSLRRSHRHRRSCHSHQRLVCPCSWHQQPLGSSRRSHPCRLRGPRGHCSRVPRTQGLARPTRRPAPKVSHAVTCFASVLRRARPICSLGTRLGRAPFPAITTRRSFSRSPRHLP